LILRRLDKNEFTAQVDTMTGSKARKFVKKAKGFTLVELIIVLALLAIVAAIASPSFQRMAINAGLRSAAKDIMSDFANLKARAVAENTPFQITFDMANNNYTFPGLANPKSPRAFGNISITGVNFGGGSTINFQTRGTAAAGTVTLKENGRNSTATITVNITGRTWVAYTWQ
jgi:type II secretion system protein H